MSTTLVGDVTEQAQKIWAPLMVDELVEQSVLPSIVNSEYDGQIKQLNDTVYVSMVRNATGTRKTVGSGHETFEAEQMQTVRKAIVADQVITGSFKVDNLIDLQTQLGSPEGKSKIRSALVKSLELNLNDYLYSLVSPSLSAPDHSLSGVTDFNAAQFLTVRKLASQAKWMKDGNWYQLLDPSYTNDILNASTLVSQDFVDDKPVIGGQVVQTRFGFKVVEDNSDAMRRLSPTLASEDFGLAFHRDFMYLVMQQQPEFKVSDLHPLQQHGYLISVSMVVGATLGIEGELKHIVIYNA